MRTAVQAVERRSCGLRLCAESQSVPSKSVVSDDFVVGYQRVVNFGTITFKWSHAYKTNNRSSICLDITVCNLRVHGATSG